MPRESKGVELHRIGEILLRRGVIDRAELERCLAERAPPEQTPLGSRLVAGGRLAPDELRAAVAEQRRLRASVLANIHHIPRLGDILRRRGLIDEIELAEALDEQEGSWEALGAILLRRGRLRPSDLERALQDQRHLRERVLEVLSTVPRLGDLLCRKGLVSREQLEAALDRQRESGHRLGNILVRDGVLRLEDLVISLAEQTHLRNAALAALFGMALVLQPGGLEAGEMAESSSETVAISITIPQKVEVAANSPAHAGLLEVVGAASSSDMTPVVSLTPFSGAAHIEVRGSGPGGSLMATAADGTALPYHVELHDPLTGEISSLGAGEGATMTAMPSLISIGFDGIEPSELGPVSATGTLVLMVSPQI